MSSVVFIQLNEKYTTQICSSCGAISDNSPKGKAGLGSKEWTCCACGNTHSRAVKAAKNISELWRQSLAAGIPSLQCKRQPKAEGVGRLSR